ncbi:MAG: hypothetical protein M0D53_00765 [Flavobacterium sp. JAD_PAG50586_2]|nr:MAG: hypothetical protein M0D53_00765 [Flavobacterium sp. JAD_PAG50586_2]
MESTEDLDITYLKSYLPGQVIDVDVLEVIKPSQIITNCVYGFTGRLSILDLSWCLPEAQDQFEAIKVGDRISCVIVDVDFDSKQIKLSKKHLEKQKSTIIKWTRIDRGDELIGNITEEYLEFDLLKTTEGHYGLLPKSYSTKIKKI